MRRIRIGAHVREVFTLDKKSPLELWAGQRVCFDGEWFLTSGICENCGDYIHNTFGCNRCKTTGVRK